MNKTVEYFLNYVAYPTKSDEESETCPSSREKQMALGKVLEKDLKEAGLAAFMDDFGYVYGDLPATADCPANVPTVGLIAHMDTSEACADAPIHARKVSYTGGDVVLSKDETGKETVLSPKDYPNMKNYVGKTLIVTDGKTLLGADDKAGIAEIMNAVKELAASSRTHGRIRVAFTPDEEIGRGTDHFDVEGFAADLAYTVDGGAIGELECENFNAAAARITVNGISIHPGSAKGKMKNAASLACEFAQALPADMVPEKTEKYEGFFHLVKISGTVEAAELYYIIRDHDRTLFEEKKALLTSLIETFNARYGEGTFVCEMADTYYNMKEIIDRNPAIVEHALAAMKNCDIAPIIQPIRGGTDGAMLCYQGLPCPNLGVGGENFHSRFEFSCAEDMEKISDYLVELVCSFAE